MQNSTNQRLEILDCLRGLACLIVLVGHCLAVFNWDTGYLKTFGVFNLTDGRSAVTFFFVLSGFVLTYPNIGKEPRPLNIPVFFIKRFTRIWLPWFAIFLIAMIAQKFFFDSTFIQESGIRNQESNTLNIINPFGIKKAPFKVM